MTAQKKIKNIFLQGAINPDFIAAQIKKHSTKTNIGAHQIFLGQVRADSVNDKIVAAIEYTAYEEMALQKMDEIREAVFEKYELTCLHVYHSLGKVNAGEICLFVFVSSKHRTAAVNSCAELVERIKAALPVWGKEIFENNQHQWKVNQ
jgi:molybdopterin synthase catalytic subunit